MLSEQQIREEIGEHEEFVRIWERDPRNGRTSARIAMHQICIRTLRRVLEEATSVLDDDLDLAGFELTSLLEDMGRAVAFYQMRDQHSN